MLPSRPFLNGHARLNRRLGKIASFLKILPLFFYFGDIQRSFGVKEANNMFIQGDFFDWSSLNLAMFKSLYKIPYFFSRLLLLGLEHSLI